MSEDKKWAAENMRSGLKDVERSFGKRIESAEKVIGDKELVTKLKAAKASTEAVTEYLGKKLGYTDTGA